MKYITQFNAERNVWCIHWLEESNASSYIETCDYLTYEKRELAESKCLQLNKEKDVFLTSFRDHIELVLEDKSECVFQVLDEAQLRQSNGGSK